MRKLFIVISVVGGAFYFLHPAKGKRRRQDALDRFGSSLGGGSQSGGFASQAQSIASSVAGQAQSVASKVSSQTPAVVRETVQRGHPDNPNPDDNTLRDRVETELFRDSEIPKGELNIFVVDGVVDLRGELPSQTMIDKVIQRAESVEHVRGVRSYLHLPHTDAPNKEEAIEAGEGNV
ncbi:MAG: BON domain-containing protein [Chloroflexota bacterium]